MHEALEDQRVSGQQAGIDQRGADHGVAGGKGTGLSHRADGVPEDQPHVEHVADQPLGQGEQARGGRRPVEDHQVDVAIGRHVAAAITAVGHDRDVADEPLGTGLAEVLQGILDQFQDYGIAQVAVQRAELDPRAAGRMPGLEVLVAFCQPRLGGQHVGAKHRGRS